MDKLFESLADHHNKIFKTYEPHQTNRINGIVTNSIKLVGKSTIDEDCMTYEPNCEQILKNFNNKFIEDNVNKSFPIIDFMIGVFSKQKSLKKNYRQDREMIYLLSNTDCFTIKEDSLDINKRTLLKVIRLYYRMYHSPEDEHAEDWGEEGFGDDFPQFAGVDCQNEYEILDEGESKYVITQSLVNDMNIIDKYADKYFTNHKISKTKKEENIEKKISKIKILKNKSLFNIDIDMKIKQKYFDLVYEEMFGHIPTDNLKNPTIHKNRMKKKFMLDNPFEDADKRTDYLLHAFVVFFNDRVERMTIS